MAGTCNEYDIEKININCANIQPSNSNKGTICYLVADHTSNQLLNTHIICALNAHLMSLQKWAISIHHNEFTHKPFVCFVIILSCTYTLDSVFAFQLCAREKTHQRPINRDRAMVESVNFYDFFLPALRPSLASHTCLPPSSDGRWKSPQFLSLFKLFA
jgi:hypothetical protein